jgi:hypothetical protein
MAILLILIAGKRPGSKRACVRQHTLEGPDLQRARPAPPRGRKKEKK